MKRSIGILALLFAMIAVFTVGCGSTPATVNVDATVEARVQAANVDATIEARVQATLVASGNKAVPTAALPAPTKTPSPIPPTPTLTPIPPTSTPTPSPVPPTSTPTPDPRLFWDDFETGIKPEWGMVGEKFTSVNGFLTDEGGFLESKIIGDSSWHNYAVKLDSITYCPGRGLQVLVRVQDSDNYMYVLFNCREVGLSTYSRTSWHKVIKGVDEEIPGTNWEHLFFSNGIFRFEVQDSVYRVFLNGERILYFVDETFSAGGFRLIGKGSMSIAGIEILNLP